MMSNKWEHLKSLWPKATEQDHRNRVLQGLVMASPALPAFVAMANAPDITTKVAGVCLAGGMVAAGAMHAVMGPTEPADPDVDDEQDLEEPEIWHTVRLARNGRELGVNEPDPDDEPDIDGPGGGL